MLLSPAHSERKGSDPNLSLRWLGIALLAASLASAALARTPALPRELRGRLALEVASCRAVGGDELLEASVRLRAQETRVALPGLHCGAFDARGDVFFLTPVAGALELAPGEAREFSARFAADARHRECGCSVRDVRDLARETPPRSFAPEASSAGDQEFEAFLAQLSASDGPDAAIRLPADAAPLGRERAPAAPPGLRYERVLAPKLALLDAPDARAAEIGALPPGARVAVDRIQRGWKRVRGADGSAGWIPGDAATPDVGAPERLRDRLAPLRAVLAAGGSASEALCRALDREQLGELVAAWRIEQRAVYLRPLWYALPDPERDAFQSYASDCYGVTRLYDAARGLEIRSEEWQAAPSAP